MLFQSYLQKIFMINFKTTNTLREGKSQKPTETIWNVRKLWWFKFAFLRIHSRLNFNILECHKSYSKSKFCIRKFSPTVWCTCLWLLGSITKLGFLCCLEVRQPKFNLTNFKRKEWSRTDKITHGLLVCISSYFEHQLHWISWIG